MNQSPPPWDPALPPQIAAAAAEGDAASGLTFYEGALRDGANDPAILTGYGELLWRLYRFDEAGAIFRSVIDDARADYGIIRRIAHAYFQIGRFGKSAEAMRAAVTRTAGPDAAALTTLAWTLERDHQLDAARGHADEALAIDSDYGPAARLLAHLDRRDGEFDGAVRRLTERLARGTGEFEWGLRYELAGVLDRLGQYDAAWAELTRAKELLAERANHHLRDARFIRRRQADVAQAVTAVDLRRWREAGASLAPPKRVALLTGFPRSGTTLLEQIVASHPDAIGTDETGILPSQFIAPLIWQAPDPITAIIELRSFDAGQLRAGRETFFELTQNYLGEPIGTRLLVEKNPLLTADLPVALRLFPEALLLIALRDPRDVALSYLMTMVPLHWGSAAAIDVVESCRFYADTMRHWLWWRERLEWPACELRYEHMIEDPAAELRRVAEFLGLAWDAGMLDERRRSERRAVRTPTYDDVTKPLYTRAIGRWKNYERHLAPGLRVLEPFVAALGYSQ